MAGLFKRYEVFYNMLLAASVMTNTYTDDATDDVKKIISFIGEAYGVDADYIREAERVILDELVTIATVQDLTAFDAAKSFDTEYDEFDRYAEVKNEIIIMLENIRKHTYIEQCGWVNHTHYCIYQAEMRQRMLREHSITGDLISTRMTGILLALGIGCEINYQEAERKLLQCSLWGDIPSAIFLAHVARMANDPRQGYLAEYASLLTEHLACGLTVLDSKVKAEHSPEACLLYVYTSSIKYDVVYSLNNPKIDFSFLEVIMSDIPYAEKMTYIDEYDRKVWKKRTNSITEAAKSVKIGFNA